MPKPYYMLCSQSGSIDRESGLISHFAVIERIQFQPAPEDLKNSDKPVVGMFLPMLITATWTRDEHDKDSDVFEFEMGLSRPGESEEKVIHKGEFRFEKLHYRIAVSAQFGPPAKAKSGNWVFESRIRCIGSKLWLRQQFPICAEVLAPPASHKQNGKKKRKRR
jgi:hypothetical protein